MVEKFLLRLIVGGRHKRETSFPRYRNMICTSPLLDLKSRPLSLSQIFCSFYSTKKKHQKFRRAAIKKEKEKRRRKNGTYPIHSSRADRA